MRIVNDNAVTDKYITFYNHSGATIDVNDRIILNACVFMNDYGGVVGTNYNTGSYKTAISDGDIADNDGLGVNEAFW